jgi:hypothetical protein
MKIMVHRMRGMEVSVVAIFVTPVEPFTGVFVERLMVEREFQDSFSMASHKPLI